MCESEFSLDKKGIKDLNCRFIGLIYDKKIQAAERCLAKYKHINNSPLLWASRIILFEELDDNENIVLASNQANRLFESLNDTNPESINEYFVKLFSYYLSSKNLPKAESIFDKSKEAGLTKSSYGMLWVKYCDLKGDIDEGVNSIIRYFKKLKKKLKPGDIKFFKKKYPTLGESDIFKKRFK